MIVLKLNEILDRPGGTKLNAIVEVHLDRILKAVLIFKGMMIEWVVVKGWEEELVKQDTGQPDIWGESRYHVGEPFFVGNFQLVSGFPTHHGKCQCGNASFPISYLSWACCQVIHDLPSQVGNTLCQAGNRPYANPTWQFWEPVQRQVPQLWEPSPGQPTTHLERVQDSGSFPPKL